MITSEHFESSFQVPSPTHVVSTGSFLARHVLESIPKDEEETMRDLLRNLAIEALRHTLRYLEESSQRRDPVSRGASEVDLEETVPREEEKRPPRSHEQEVKPRKISARWRKSPK